MLHLYAALTAITLAKTCKDADDIRAMGDRLMQQIVSEAMTLKTGTVRTDVFRR